MSYVLETPPAAPAEACRLLAARLSMECDAWDVYADQRDGCTDFVVVDARTAPAYADMHIPGALLLPSRAVNADSVAAFRGKAVVVYAWGTGCNAATKAAARLAALGVPVKEIIGGLEAWLRNGYPVEGDLPAGVTFDAYLAWHHREDSPYRP